MNKAKAKAHLQPYHDAEDVARRKYMATTKEEEETWQRWQKALVALEEEIKKVTGT